MRASVTLTRAFNDWTAAGSMSSEVHSSENVAGAGTSVSRLSTPSMSRRIKTSTGQPTLPSAQRTAVQQRPHPEIRAVSVEKTEPVVHHHGRQARRLRPQRGAAVCCCNSLLGGALSLSHQGNDRPARQARRAAGWHLAQAGVSTLRQRQGQERAPLRGAAVRQDVRSRSEAGRRQSDENRSRLGMRAGG